MGLPVPDGMVLPCRRQPVYLSKCLFRAMVSCGRARRNPAVMAQSCRNYPDLARGAVRVLRCVRGDMDVFGVHEQLIWDYREFTSGAVNVRDEDIADHVRRGLDEGEQ